ncbi:MAG TPA: phytanoyl-CoA dioxygenase family protein [Chthonomonadaceae bacterium]|nr:phytanoyl-CoA dioxygenase family protein [Chthonomonadaceae bacterium]
MAKRETSPLPEEGFAMHAPELYTHGAIAEGVEGFGAVGEEHIAWYQEQGYLVVDGAFTQAEVEAARQGLLDLIAGRNPAFDNFDIEPLGREQLPALTGEDRQNAIRKLMDFTRFDDRLKAIAEHPQLVAVIARLIGEKPERFQDMALIKPPRLGREKPWHQDHAYFDLPLGTRIIGVWIALDEATLENGCMHVLAGGHRNGPLPHFQRRDWQICDSEMLGKRSVAVPLKPGGCLFFDGLLPHGTPHNHSALRRRALQFHYRPASVVAATEEERLAVFGGEGRGVSC